MRCSICKADHPETEFTRDATRHSGFSSSCTASKRAKYKRKRKRKRNPEQERIKARAQRARRRSEAIARLGGKCQECGWSGPTVGFDIHHANGGGEEHRKTMAYIAYYRYIRDHPEEFRLLCAICHRIHHAEE